MLIRVISDLHIEFAALNLLNLPDDKDTVLVVAGDVCSYKNERVFVPFFKQVSAMFPHVIYVAGNHEFYGGGSLIDGYEHINDILDRNGLNNVYLLQNETKTIDGVSFIGGTLWTDFNQNNPMKKILVRQYLNDYTQTFYDDSRRRFITPDDIYDSHVLTRDYIFESVVREKEQGNKTVVVVHHGVSDKSVHRRFAGDPINSGFVSSLDRIIEATSPDVVVHGHVHNAFDYMIGTTHVVVNPRGYPRENNEWDECLTIEV